MALSVAEYGEEALQLAWKRCWDTEGYNAAHDGVSADKTGVGRA